MLAFLMLVVLSVVLHLIARHLSKPRLHYEFALSQQSWDDIRQFWTSVGRLS